MRKRKKSRGPIGAYKGPAFERQTARALSLWASDGCEVDKFTRSPGSGSTTTMKGQERARHAGDIIANDERASMLTSKFVVECKHVANADCHTLFYMHSPKSFLLREWFKLLVTCLVANREPMLIVRQNYAPVIAVFRRPLNTVVAKCYAAIPISNSWALREVNGGLVPLTTRGGLSLYVYRFDEVMEIPYAHFCRRGLKHDAIDGGSSLDDEEGTRVSMENNNVVDQSGSKGRNRGVGNPRRSKRCKGQT